MNQKQKLWKAILIPTVSLFLICVISTVLLAVTNSVTAPMIEDLAAKTAAETRQTVLNAAERFSEPKAVTMDGAQYTYYEGFDGDTPVGYVFTTQSKGYGGAVEIMVNTNGYEEAVWGDLCDEIVKELTAGLKKIPTTLLKLSAFLAVCKAMLELGPEWLDEFVRQVLYEALSNGMEAGIVTGDGNKKPIGMTRQVGDSVVVSGGVYPEKERVKLYDLSPVTVGNLISIMAADPNGKPRRVQDVIFLVNPQDYFQKVMPATTLMAPDGSYRNDVMPYPMTIIQVPALKRGEAVMGIAYRYLALAGTSPNGRVEYSDHYRFLEDERVYLIKAYANGMPLDNNAFLHLDISGLKPATWKVTMVEEPAPSTDATLSALAIGGLTLAPAFASGTTTYTAETANATNTITATPADAGASIQVLVDDKEISNGTAATWKSGSNTVTINVTAADGTTKKAYTVTVTKS